MTNSSTKFTAMLPLLFRSCSHMDKQSNKYYFRVADLFIIQRDNYISLIWFGSMTLILFASKECGHTKGINTLGCAHFESHWVLLKTDKETDMTAKEIDINNTIRK